MVVGDERSALCSFPKLSSRYVKPEKCIVVENKEVGVRMKSLGGPCCSHMS